MYLRNGDIATYIGTAPYSCQIDDRTYTVKGEYCLSGQGPFDVVEILPLETIEPTTSDKHPSVAWWESCPWITDRKPTPLDGDVYGRVYIKSSKNKVLTSNWSEVGAHENWIHLCGWQPPVLTDKEKALELLNKHEGVWTPTLREWNVIRKGLTE
jgi:hypothetical protein